MSSDDILFSVDAKRVSARPTRAQVAAFVPITIAMIGVGIVLFGGVSARSSVTASVSPFDPVATGSIAPAAGVGRDDGAR